MKYHHIALFIIVAILVNIIFYYTSESPLYYWRPTDIQEDYFYGALRLYDGVPVIRALHPGIPIYYFLRLIFGLIGEPVRNAGIVFLVGYLATAAILAISMLTFANAFRTVGSGWRLLPTSVLLAWPPTFFYSLTYGADSFVLPLSVLTVALTWKWLDLDVGKRQLWRWALLGALCGFAVTVKLSLLVPAVAIFAALATKVVVAPTRRMTIAGLGLFCLFGLVTALVFLFPVLWNIATYAKLIVAPPDYLQTASAGFARVVIFIDRISDYQPLVGAVFAAALATALAGGFLTFLEIFRNPESREPLLPRGVLFVLLLAGLYMSMGTVSDGDGVPQVMLRNGSAAIVAIPLGIFLLLESRTMSRIWRGRTEFLAAGVSVVIVSLALFAESDIRAQYNADRKQLQNFWGRAIAEVAGPGKAVAVAEMANEASFHFYGNDNYGGDRFDRLLVSIFPDFSYLRRVSQLPMSPQQGSARDNGRKAPRGETRGYWDSPFKPPVASQVNELLVPPAAGRRLSGVVVRNRDLPPGCDLGCFTDRLKREGYKARILRITQYRDSRFIIIALE